VKKKFQSIGGFGSLLSERSAKSTFPNLHNFRLAKLKNWRRVFAHVGTVFFVLGIARPDTREMSGLSVEEYEGEELFISVFDIPIEEVPLFYAREEPFRFEEVNYENLDGTPASDTIMICAHWNDIDYKRVKCHNSEEEFHKKYGQYGIDKVWCDDVFPCRPYLRHCVLAATKLGEVILNNFLDHTYLADRKTTIRQYLTQKPEIMTELPPANLGDRYNG